MSNLTNLCLNRLDADPYLHRLIPHITHYVRDYPDQHITIVTDKQLFANGLYLSLIEHRIPVTLYNEFHPIPLNLLEGDLPSVTQRFEQLGLLTPLLAQQSNETLFNQMNQMTLLNGLRLIKHHYPKQTALGDLSKLLTAPQYIRQPFLIELKQSLIYSDQPELSQICQWFEEQSTLKSTQSELKEYAPLGSFMFQQFESEWRTRFSSHHRLDEFFKPTINIIDVHQLKRIKEPLTLYLLEILGEQSKQKGNISLFLDLHQTLSDEKWSELLLNNNLEVTQIRHTPKENEWISSVYESRSIKYFRHYSITHKEQIMKAIYEFKCPNQLKKETEIRSTAKPIVKPTVKSMTTSKRRELVSSTIQEPLLDDWLDQLQPVLGLYDTIDFEKSNLI